jgi:hypothetical protein
MLRHRQCLVSLVVPVLLDLELTRELSLAVCKRAICILATLVCQFILFLSVRKSYGVEGASDAGIRAEKHRGSGCNSIVCLPSRNARHLYFAV